MCSGSQEAVLRDQYVRALIFLGVLALSSENNFSYLVERFPASA